MFEDRYIFNFVCALLGVASIIIPGPIVPIIAMVIVIAMLVYKIKRAKESREGFESLMLDIAVIIIFLVVEIGFSIIRISSDYQYNKNNYLASSSQKITATDIAENAIVTYKLGNISQFSEKANKLNAIKSGFTAYLKDEIGISDVSVKGNKIICDIGADHITFTVTKNDIKYSIK